MKYPLHNIKFNKNKYSYNLIILSASLIIIFYFIAGLYIQFIGCHNMLSLADSKSIVGQQGISNKIIRFHIKGYSDSAEDQAIKLLIKDEIIHYLKPYLINVTSKNEAEAVIISHLDKIAETAQNMLNETSFTYTASAALSKEYFPVKSYGDIVLPAGVYNALTISLGDAKGQNWWCIMFPQLCFLDASYSIVPDSSKAELKYLLTDEEYKSILREPPNIQYKSKLLEWLKKVFLSPQ